MIFSDEQIICTDQGDEAGTFERFSSNEIYNDGRLKKMSNLGSHVI